MTRGYPTTSSTELLRPNRSVTRYGGISAQFTRMAALCRMLAMMPEARSVPNLCISVPTYTIFYNQYPDKSTLR